MALEAGSGVKGTGLAGAIAAARKKAFPDGYKVKNDPAVDLEAEAIIEYFKANAEVIVDEIEGSPVEGTGHLE